MTEFEKAKKNYLARVAPQIRRLYRVVTKYNSLIATFGVWVTDYGYIDGTETDDEVIKNILTYNGHSDDYNCWFNVDISFVYEEKYFDKTLHQDICNIIGDDFYDSRFYRLEEYNSLEDIVKTITEVCEMLEN